MPRKPKPLSAPGVPTGLTATPGNMLINLAWNAPASNGGSTITAYRVYRNDQLWHQTAGARFYLDNTSLVAGAQYRYRVSAVTAIGEGLKSAEVSVTAINTNPPPVYTAPSAPASLTATGGNGLVNLTWTAPVSNGGTAITGYRVYRNGSSLIVLGNVLTYQNTGLSNGIPYSYQVAAINAVGEGPQSVSKTATPGDLTPPIVSVVTHGGVTQTTATVSWSINEPATGQVEYGPTTGYGSTTTFEPSYLLAHAQVLSGLTPGIVYHYRAKSLDVAGNPGYSSDRQFQTAGTPPLSVIYGPGIGFETKSNHYIGGSSLAKSSCRFRASQSSAVAKVAINQRFGVDYSLGTGGTCKLDIYADSGGVPSGSILGTVTFSPGNPAGNIEHKEQHNLVTPALVAGQFYHLVASNVHASQASNYFSINFVLEWGSPVDPFVGGESTALYNTGGGWSVINGETPVFDIQYANGAHDGQQYYEIVDPVSAPGQITGTTHMARCRFTVSGGSRTVTAVKVKVRRISGTSPLIVRLENGDGSLIESVSVSSSSIAVVSVESGTEPVSWATATFITPRTLANGQTYNVRLSTAAGTNYAVKAIRWKDMSGDGSMSVWNGYHFRDGAGNANGSSGQRTTNSGGSWADLYQFDPVDIGFYFL